MRNKKIFVLAGRSGSGKTSCFNLLLKMGYKKILTVTTRPPREDEVDGVNYFFVPKGQDKVDTDILLVTSIGDYDYGFKMSELTKYEKAFISLDTKGIRDIEQLVNPNNIHVIFLDVPKELSIQRLLKRGDNPEILPNRLHHDDEMYSKEMLGTIRSHLHIIDGVRTMDEIMKDVLYIIEQEKQSSVNQNL